MEQDISSFVVAIEWDGNRPPTKWYRRLAAFGFTVSGTGDKELGPVERRASWTKAEKGVVFQEGLILCEAESTARTLGHLASQCGARAVFVGAVELTSLRMTQQDEYALARVAATVGKRGKPANPAPWVVTCLDEGRTYAQVGREPSCCPGCRSFRIAVRPGEAHAVAPAITHTYQDWIKSRFVGGVFEIPVEDPAALPASGTPFGFEDVRRVRQLETALVDLGNDPEIPRFRLWDLAWLASGLDLPTRQSNRIKAAADFIARGKDLTAANLVATEQIDLLDLYSFDKPLIRLLVDQGHL